ncbi:MAG: pyridoxal-phosphate dependent enzyme, partial [Myxococcales bacterium]|nr:pyridoxal-phosphate dependent enzyme [Myxococcales bacterium]
MNLLYALPRVPLAGGPTPLQALPRLSAALGGPTLWCKRDDLTALGGGGNKARKLEYLLAAARADGADTVITFGGAHSNHARMTAVAARMLGLEPILVLTGTPLDPPVGNLLLDHLAGARIEWAPDYGAGRDALVADLKAELARAGRRAAWIPGGGTTPLGAMGYVRAALELRAQCEAEGIRPAAM